MTLRPLEFQPGAADEVDAAIRWYAGRSLDAAHALLAELDDAIVMIESPERWPPHDHGTRRCFLQRFPFLIIFRERAAGIQVIAFAHARRRPGYRKSRLD